jgi:hypothetical protein
MKEVVIAVIALLAASIGATALADSISAVLVVASIGFVTAST